MNVHGTLEKPFQNLLYLSHRSECEETRCNQSYPLIQRLIFLQMLFKVVAERGVRNLHLHTCRTIGANKKTKHEKNGCTHAADDCSG